MGVGGGAEERDMSISDSTTVPVSRPSKRSCTSKTSFPPSGSVTVLHQRRASESD